MVGKVFCSLSYFHLFLSFRFFFKLKFNLRTFSFSVPPAGRVRLYYPHLEFFSMLRLKPSFQEPGILLVQGGSFISKAKNK